MKIEQGRLRELLLLGTHIIITALISYAVECSTAIMGVAFIVFFYFAIKKSHGYIPLGEV